MHQASRHGQVVVIVLIVIVIEILFEIVILIISAAWRNGRLCAAG